MGADNGTRRIAVLDELRGWMILLMVVHHFGYTMGYLFDKAWGRALFQGFGILHPIGAGLFIVICGFCCRLSHSNLRRGLLLAGVAAATSLALYVFMPSAMIWYGILHMLATCILLYAGLARLLKHVPLWLGVTACALLFALTWHVPAGVVQPFAASGGFFGIRGLWEVAVPVSWQAQRWLYPLGIGIGESADYFPLLPWAFLFFGGTFLGRLAPRAPDFLCRSYVPPIAFIGRHTLWVYLLHQPIIYAVAYVVCVGL